MGGKTTKENTKRALMVCVTKLMKLGELDKAQKVHAIADELIPQLPEFT